MAQFPGYALFFAHPNTPLFNDNQVTVSPELFKAISARLQAQLRDASNTSLLEGGSSITIPYNSPEQPPIPKGTPSGPGQPGVVRGTSILVPMHQWMTEASARQATSTKTPTQIPLPASNPTPHYEIDPNDLLTNYRLTNDILAMADFHNFQLVVVTRTCAAFIPKYGPILVPTGPSNPPIQPSILDPPLSRADIATSENLQNAPDWQIIYIGASSFHQCALFFFSPECTTALLKYYFVAQIFLLGVGRVRSAKKIDGQPEDLFYFPGDDGALLSRTLGTLEHPPRALVEELVELHNTQSKWLENFILAYVVHLYYHTVLDWEGLTTEEDLAKLVLSHPFEEKYTNIPFATKHVYAILTVVLLAGPFNMRAGFFPLSRSRVGNPSIIPAEVLANIMTIFSWALGLALNQGNGNYYPSYLAYCQLPATERLFDFYLKVTHAVEQLELYQEFIDKCLSDAKETTTRAVIDELITPRLLPNPALYLSWYGVQFEG